MRRCFEFYVGVLISFQLKGTESIQAASGYFNLANTIDGKQVKNSLYLKGQKPNRSQGLISNPLYLVLECWLEILNSNELETITQAEIYESAKILQDLAKVITWLSSYAPHLVHI